MIFLSSIDKDSITTTRNSFKSCILACKIRNQMHRNFEKRKVPQAVSGNFAQNSCSVRHMFCTIFVLLSVAKVLKKHAQSSSYLVLVFLYCNYSAPHYSNWKFLELLFLVGDRKIDKIYQRKLKSGNRLLALEITHWKLSVYGKLFSIRQTLQLSQFYRALLADLCALLINTFENFSKANLRPGQHLKWNCLWH